MAFAIWGANRSKRSIGRCITSVLPQRLLCRWPRVPEENGVQKLAGLQAAQVLGQLWVASMRHVWRTSDSAASADCFWYKHKAARYTGSCVGIGYAALQ